MTLGGVVITLNSEKRIGALLRSMRLFVDELVVVLDKRCNDGTEEISRQFADTVVSWEIPEGMPQAVQAEAFLVPKSDWVIFLNDDELISKRILDFKSEMLNSPDNVAGYYLPLYWLVLDERHYIASPSVWPNYGMRVFRRGAAVQQSKLLHYPLKVKGGEGVFLFPLRIFHYHLLIRSREEREAGWEVMKTRPCYMDIEFFRQFYLWEDYHFKIGTVPDKPLKANGDGGYLK